MGRDHVPAKARQEECKFAAVERASTSAATIPRCTISTREVAACKDSNNESRPRVPPTAAVVIISTSTGTATKVHDTKVYLETQATAETGNVRGEGNWELEMETETETETDRTEGVPRTGIPLSKISKMPRGNSASYCTLVTYNLKR